MKDRPYIELSQLDLIIRQLNRRRKFRITRGGAKIVLWTVPSEQGVQIHYQIFLKRGVNVFGWKLRVRDVIEAVNDSLAKRACVRRAADPSQIRIAAPVMTPAPQDRWLPYKDAEL